MIISECPYLDGECGNHAQCRRCINQMIADAQQTPEIQELQEQIEYLKVIDAVFKETIQMI